MCYVTFSHLQHTDVLGQISSVYCHGFQAAHWNLANGFYSGLSILRVLGWKVNHRKEQKSWTFSVKMGINPNPHGMLFFLTNWLWRSLWANFCPSPLHSTVWGPDSSRCYEAMLFKSMATGIDPSPCLALTAVIPSVINSLSRTLCPPKGRSESLSMWTRYAAWGVKVG